MLEGWSESGEDAKVDRIRKKERALTITKIRNFDGDPVDGLMAT